MSGMGRIIDGDSHFMEPLDLWERYLDPAFRGREVRAEVDPESGARRLIVDEGPMMLTDVEVLLGALVGYGQKEEGGDLSSFDRYLAENPRWQDMDARVEFIRAEGFDAQVLYPSLGLVWEGSVGDPLLADAL